MEPEKINYPYLTAIKRTELSVPTRNLLQHNLLKGKILDFGCGFGFDTDELKRQGYNIMGYDYYYRPDYPEGKFDTIICNYVLNLLEPYAQTEVLIKLPRKEGEICPFCRFSRRVEVICETATCVAFYDGYPVSPGYALIIPKRHVANFFDLTNHEREAMNVVLQYVKQKVDERFHPDGYNVGINIGEAAGQSVFHCHMHVIPRYKGDVPTPKGGVRGVIPSKQSYSTKGSKSAKDSNK